ncbi:MAG TPA: prepilin-type N-terminal cleavage/methylation domain-containing protein [Pyrinomonadaceae bacterium]|jgi:type II secretory pathway pseudopilin PulG|nr:prepilin-type N-terminal cleavage/methylation domain-containing protein [Pyrinomonadaceae bacterium]
MKEDFRLREQAGFSYIEVMVAMVILMVGILGVMAAISGSVLMSRGQQQQLTARHIAATTMESIMSAKETDPSRLGWKSIGNVGSNPDENGVPQGVFVNGYVQVLSGAGPDEVLGTADDNGPAINGFSRKITITDICDPDRPSQNCPQPGNWAVRMRSVEVRVRYVVGNSTREEVLRTILTDYSVTN